MQKRVIYVPTIASYRGYRDCREVGCSGNWDLYDKRTGKLVEKREGACCPDDSPAAGHCRGSLGDCYKTGVVSDDGATGSSKPTETLEQLNSKLKKEREAAELIRKDLIEVEALLYLNDPEESNLTSNQILNLQDELQRLRTSLSTTNARIRQYETVIAYRNRK